MARFFLALALLLVACGGDARDRTSAGGRAQVRAEPGLVTGLSVRGERGSGGDVVPVVEARGEAPVRVKRAIALERRDGGRWVAVNVRDLTLRADCARPAGACITLVRGGGLRPPPWNGKASGAGQCGAPEGRDAPPGTYRFVLESCEGDGRVQGEPFAFAR